LPKGGNRLPPQVLAIVRVPELTAVLVMGGSFRSGN
jgi:hypothetical protein